MVEHCLQIQIPFAYMSLNLADAYRFGLSAWCLSEPIGPARETKFSSFEEANCKRVCLQVTGCLEKRKEVYQFWEAFARCALHLCPQSFVHVTAADP
jgi:hypothetical protein